MARRRLRLGFKLRSPVAERLERNPLGLAILPLIQLAPTLLVTVLSHSFGQMTCGSPARAGDLGRRAGRATCAVGGQRNPLSDHKDKIVDFYHL